MVVNICKQLSLETNTDLVSRAITSVRYWVAHKSWRLRDHFKVLGTLNPTLPPCLAAAFLRPLHSQPPDL